MQRLERRDFDLVRERRLDNLDRCLCGDRDLDDDRELRLLSLFQFPQLRLRVRVRPSFVVWQKEPDLDLERLSMGQIASDMAATDACTADWITVSSDVLSICVAMVGVSVVATVDKAAAGSVVVVVAPSEGKRATNSRLIRSGLEPVETR